MVAFRVIITVVVAFALFALLLALYATHKDNGSKYAAANIVLMICVAAQVGALVAIWL